jgi:hypothetical protein
MGAVQFIENLDRTTLTISDEDFEKNVEAAVFAIAEKHEAAEPSPPAQHQLAEKGPQPGKDIAAGPSGPREPSATRKSTSSNEGDGDGIDEKAAMSGLLRTIQRPLSSIGRIFSEEPAIAPNGPARTPLPGNTPRLSPAPGNLDRHGSPQQIANEQPQFIRNRPTAEESAARQASAEAAEAHRLQQAEHANVVETLAGMFPDLDRDIISDVVVQKNGR